MQGPLQEQFQSLQCLQKQKLWPFGISSLALLLKRKPVKVTFEGAFFLSSPFFGPSPTTTSLSFGRDLKASTITSTFLFFDKS